MTFPGLDPSPPTTGRQPHEVLIAGICVLSGIAGMFGAVSATMSRVLHTPFLYVYFGGLILAGVVTLIGIFNDRIEGALLERIGLGILSTFLTAYAIALLGNGVENAFYAASFPIAVTIANVIRIIQINRRMRAVREVDPHEADH